MRTVPAALSTMRLAAPSKTQRTMQADGGSRPRLLEFWSVVTHPSSTGGASDPFSARDFIDALITTAGAAIFAPPPSVGLRCLQIAEQLKVRGPRVFDLEIGLTALESGVTEIWTRDSGFVGLPGLRVRDPLRVTRPAGSRRATSIAAPECTTTPACSPACCR